MAVKGLLKARRVVNQLWPLSIHNLPSTGRWNKDSRYLNLWSDLNRYIHQWMQWCRLKTYTNLTKTISQWEVPSIIWHLLISNTRCSTNKCITKLNNNMIPCNPKSSICLCARPDHLYLSSSKWIIVIRTIISSTATTMINFNENLRLPKNK